MGPSLREAALRQDGPFLLINGAPSLTRRPERISKREMFASPNGSRTSDLLVNNQVFETLCLTYRRMIPREERPSVRLGSAKVAFPPRAATETGRPAGGSLWLRFPVVRHVTARLRAVSIAERVGFAGCVRRLSRQERPDGAVALGTC